MRPSMISEGWVRMGDVAKYWRRRGSVKMVGGEDAFTWGSEGCESTIPQTEAAVSRSSGPESQITCKTLRED